MKLFQSKAVQEAMEALADELEAEAGAKGEEIKTFVLVAFTTEDLGTVSTAVLGCRCPGCMKNIRRSLKRIGRDQIKAEAPAHLSEVH